VRIVQRPQYAHTSAACGVGTAAIAGEEQACDIATSCGFFRPLLLPMGSWQNQQSPTLLETWRLEEQFS